MTDNAPEMSEQELRPIVEEAVEGCRQADWREGEKGITSVLQKRPFVFWRRAADLSLPAGQLLAGMCYEYGAGVSKDDAEAAACYKKAALKGHPYAQYSLACCFYHGSGVDKNQEEAVKWFRSAADQGLPEAQSSLGTCYFNGEGVTEDEKEAVIWFQKAAAQGYPSAQNDLGDCLLNGSGVEENEVEAVKCYRAAADQGSAEAQWNLGICYQNGFGVKEDDKEAVAWFQKAAAQDYPPAQNALADCLLMGQGIEMNESQAVTLYRLAADQGLPEAQHNLGFCYDNGCGVSADEKEAVAWYKKAAAQGYPQAQHDLAVYMLYGPESDRNEPEAIKLLQAAADQGNADAQNRLGLLYEAGKVVPKDKQKAISFYGLAAAQNLPVAQYNLGLSYEYGRGVPKDLRRAAEWYRKSADQTFNAAQFRLGCFYLDGKGVARDQAEGIRWLQKAAEQRYAPATKRLNKLHAGDPAAQDDEPQDEQPMSESQSNAAPIARPAETNNVEKVSGDTADPSELTVVQCVCGKLLTCVHNPQGGACECPFCHASTAIPAGPHPGIYLLSDLTGERKEGAPQRIYASAKPSVVTLVTETGTGSGFFLSSDGLILTNNHVIDGAAEVLVKQSDAATTRGRVIRSFHRLDLAFIKVRISRPTPFLRLAQSDQVQVGDGAFAIGSPHQFDGTFTEGVISTADRVIGDRHFIQTDAPISPGNSGGPLLNIYGEAVGVNTLSRTQSQNINFAVPASVVRSCLYEVITCQCEDKNYCAICGRASAISAYCDNCGTRFEPRQADSQGTVPKPVTASKSKNHECLVCGAKLLPNTQYCPRCGASSKKEASS